MNQRCKEQEMRYAGVEAVVDLHCCCVFDGSKSICVQFVLSRSETSEDMSTTLSLSALNIISAARFTVQCLFSVICSKCNLNISGRSRKCCPTMCTLDYYLLEGCFCNSSYLISLNELKLNSKLQISNACEDSKNSKDQFKLSSFYGQSVTLELVFKGTIKYVQLYLIHYRLQSKVHHHPIHSHT